MYELAASFLIPRGVSEGISRRCPPHSFVLSLKINHLGTPFRTRAPYQLQKRSSQNPTSSFKKIFCQVAGKVDTLKDAEGPSVDGEAVEPLCMSCREQFTAQSNPNPSDLWMSLARRGFE